MRDVRYTLSPLLTSKTPVWRSKFIVAMLALAFIGLIGRAAFVQVFDNDFFQRQGEQRIVSTQELPASRGRILDRNDQPLASSVVEHGIEAVIGKLAPPPGANGQMDERQLSELLNISRARLDKKLASGTDRERLNLWVDEALKKQQQARQRLAGLLGLTPGDLNRKLASGRERVWLGRNVDESLARQVDALNVLGIVHRREYQRKYPDGQAVAHVVGLVKIDNNRRGPDDLGQEGEGQEGIERSMNALLAGKPGWRRVIKDRLGQVVEAVGEEAPPVDGQDVRLSIDARVQFFAYQKLADAVTRNKAKSGSVVVADARTGEILALANYPSYDPGQRAGLAGAQMRNIAATDTFEPGSVMKPITVAMALETGKITPQTRIDTSPGSYQLDRFTIRDTHNYGVLTVEGVIQKSSNIGALKIAQKLDPRQMWETYTTLGYGRVPELEFPGAARGQLMPLKKWTPTYQAALGYGYGLSASLLQMAHSYTVFAHGGQVIPLTLLKSRDGEPAQGGVQVFSEATVRAVRRMLQMAAGPGGTGPRAQTVGYSVGGKSGTARKEQNGGYDSGKYRAWFVGIAPVENPRVIVGVMVDEPGNGDYFGGAVAAPVFSEVVQQTLRIMGVQPDLAVKPQIVTEGVEESL